VYQKRRVEKVCQRGVMSPFIDEDGEYPERKIDSIPCAVYQRASVTYGVDTGFESRSMRCEIALVE
jgi:hypothetical protein